jgi:hypothetical protein
VLFMGPGHVDAVIPIADRTRGSSMLSWTLLDTRPATLRITLDHVNRVSDPDSRGLKPQYRILMITGSLSCVSQWSMDRRDHMGHRVSVDTQRVGHTLLTCSGLLDLSFSRRP